MIRSVTNIKQLISLLPEDGVFLLEKKLPDSIKRQFQQTSLYSIEWDGSEENKTVESAFELVTSILTLGIRKSQPIIAIGGGAFCDVCGFVASITLRGVPLIFVPTTLLSMVDAAIGGKNGVNSPKGKNQIGTIYQAKEIYICFEMLETLSDQQILCGLAEIIKLSLVYCAELYFLLESLQPPIEAHTLHSIILKAATKKYEITTQDPQEKGIRTILNFGHTIGHAIEKASYYTTPHGLAVAQGIIAESFLSETLGILPKDDRKRIVHLLERYGYRPCIVDTNRFIDAIKIDKKNFDGRIRFVPIRSIGVAFQADLWTQEVTTEQCIQALMYSYDYNTSK